MALQKVMTARAALFDEFKVRWFHESGTDSIFFSISAWLGDDDVFLPQDRPCRLEIWQRTTRHIDDFFVWHWMFAFFFLMNNAGMVRHYVPLISGSRGRIVIIQFL